MSAPKARLTLTREQLDAVRWWLIVAQREDSRLVRENICPEITLAATQRLAQLEAVNRAVWHAHIPLTTQERAAAREATLAALPKLPHLEDASCTQ